MHTKVNHKYLTMKQLSHKVAAKAENEARRKYILKKKKEEIAVNFRLQFLVILKYILYSCIVGTESRDKRHAHAGCNIEERRNKCYIRQD
jgi:hypothetical protein